MSRGVPGEQHPNARLTYSLVRRIRENREGWTDYKWAEALNVDRNTIRLVRINKRWHDPNYTPGPVSRGRPRYDERR